MDEILISRSTNFSDYEILIRQRGNYEYTAFSPQLNYMVKAKDIVSAKKLLFKKINEHINYCLEHPEVVDEYNAKLEQIRIENEEFILNNLKQNAEPTGEEIENSEAEAQEFDGEIPLDDEMPFDDLELDELEPEA